MVRQKSIGVCAAIVVAVLLSGCATSAFGKSSGASQQKAKAQPISEDVLRSEVNEFGDRAMIAVNDAASQIVLQSTDSLVIRRAIRWKIIVVRRTRSVITQSDPRQGLLNAWVASARMHIWFTEGPGRDSFGDLQPIAVNASVEVLRGIEGIARRFLPEDQFAAVRDAVAGYAKASAFGSIAMEEAIDTGAVPPGGAFAAIFGLPLAPFTAVQGVSEAAAAIRGFSIVAQQLTDIAARAPEEGRWQAELFLLDIAHLEGVVPAIKSLTTAANAIAQLASTAKELPADVESLLTRVSEQVNANQAKIQLTIADARTAMADANKLLDSATPALGAAQNASSSLSDAGKSWQGVIQSADKAFGPFGAKAPAGAAPAKPFDIKDYTDALRQADEAAVHLTALVAQVQQTIQSTAVDNRVNEIASRADAAVANASANARGVVDHALLGLAALIGLAFLAAVAYRVIAVYLMRRPRKE
jgi:hypothetical protein